MSAARFDRLAQVAAGFGIETGYWDVSGAWHEPGPETVVAVLAALGAPIDPTRALGSTAGLDGALDEVDHELDARRAVALAPVVTATEGHPVCFELAHRGHGNDGPRVEVVVSLEDGTEHRHLVDLAACPVVDTAGSGRVDGQPWTRRAVELGGHPWPVGYHELAVDLDGARHRATVLVAPTHAHQPGDRERLWGAFAPLYSLRVDHGWGPDLSDLGRLGAWLDGHGGKVVGTLPLLASYPTDPTPYAPVSRRFWNEAYLPVAELAELAASPGARAWLDRPDTVARSARMRAAPTSDLAAQTELVHQVLRELAPPFFAPGAARQPEFRRWVDEHPMVIDYARFRAVTERRGQRWPDWPGRLAHGRVDPDDYDVAVAARHVYAQWSMDRQLDRVSAELAGRGQHLYLDLPVGCAPDGFDTWIEPGAYGWGAAVGAPPDDFFAAGQNWGFPPLRPDQARADGHRLLAECLRHHMAHAGLLRLDHVMGLHRLYWVPEGLDARQGTYVRYPTDEQFAVVAIESARSGCVVVGEDLGTVPDEVREAMDRHRVLRSYVAEFSLHDQGDGRGELVGPDHRMVAAVDTHDTPTFAAFVSDPAHRATLAAAVGLDASTSDAELLGAVLARLADSPAPAVLVALDDLVGATEPHNVPGTGPERANWVQRLPVALDELAGDPAVTGLIDQVQARRLASHGRAGS